MPLTKDQIDAATARRAAARAQHQANVAAAVQKARDAAKASPLVARHVPPVRSTVPAAPRGNPSGAVSPKTPPAPVMLRAEVGAPTAPAPSSPAVAPSVPHAVAGQYMGVHATAPSGSHQQSVLRHPAAPPAPPAMVSAPQAPQLANAVPGMPLSRV